MRPDTCPEPAQSGTGTDQAEALLACATPEAVLSLLAAALPGTGARRFWSARWPEAIDTDPPADDRTLARAVREVAARRAGANPDPRYLLLCDEPGGGVALLHLDEPLPAGGAHRARCEAAGRRIAELLAVERLRADVAQLEKAEKLQRALYAIADMAGSELDMPDMLRGLHAIISELMYAENFYIALYDEAADSLRFAYFADTMDRDGPPAGEVVPMSRIERGLTWYLVRDARPMMGSTEELRAQTSGPLLLHGADSTDWLGVPMLREGRVLGALVVQSYQEGTRYTGADMSLLTFVAEHVLTALERKDAREQLERRVEERTCQLAEANRDLSREVAERQRGERLQAALYRLAALASSEESSEAFFRSVHQIVGGLIDARNFYIALLSEDGSEVSFPYAVDACETDWSPRRSGRGLTEYVLRTGKPQVVDGARMLELIRAGEIDARYVDSASTSWLGAPLRGRDGPIGTVVVQSYSQARGYDARDAELLAFAAHQIASSLRRRRAAEALREANARLEERVEQRTRELRVEVAQREQAEARLRHQVMHDPLTGLPNRVYLRDRIERAIAQLRREPAQPFALLYIDVDRFKQINDNLGHLVGDDVLKEVSRRLKTIVREPDVVARLSGDEFAVLLERLTDREDAGHVAGRIIDALRKPLVVGGRELRTSASIGIAFSDRDYRDTDEVLHDADVALYRAKERGRNQSVLFDDILHRAAQDTLALRRELRDGLQAEQFEPWFEPIVRLADDAVVGYEALLRWRHPVRGVLAPEAFLDAAADSGQLEAIDWRTFRLACEAATRLPADRFVAINVNPGMLRQEGFDARLLALAEASGLRPGQLRIELGEGTLPHEAPDVAAILQRLSDAGILTAIDDFGTGAASLAMLQRLPLRAVKLDRSFIGEHIDDGDGRGHALLASLLALAHSIGLKTVAVGVETRAQREMLARMGCQHAQGYLFGRARPLSHWLPRD